MALSPLPLRVHEQRPRSSVEAPEPAGIGFLLVFLSFLIVEWETREERDPDEVPVQSGSHCILRYVKERKDRRGRNPAGSCGEVPESTGMSFLIVAP